MAVFDNINLTYSPGVAPEVTQYFQRTVEERALPELVHLRDAQMRPMPQGNGKVANFRKLVALAPITTPLAEGVTPDGGTLTEIAFSARLKSYGHYITLSDEMNYFSLSNMTLETAKLLREQALLSLDTTGRDAINAGLNVQYAGANTVRGTIASTDKLTYAEIKEAVRTLKRQNVKPFADGYYHAIVHPDAVYDLTSDAMWTDVSKYQDRMKVEKYEIGNIYGVRFYESTNAKVFDVETYLYGTTTSIVASENYDSTNNEITYSISISDAEANQLTGKLVNVQYTDGSDYVTPMCVMSVDTTNKKIKFRWQPASSVYTNWTTAKTLTIVPLGGGASDVSVFSTVVYGRDAFGTIRLAGEGRIGTGIYPPGGRDDPLKQRGIAAWFVKGFCAIILNDDAIVRIEHGATA
jgi:N4-gp56 family major capsid protein